MNSINTLDTVKSLIGRGYILSVVCLEEGVDVLQRRTTNAAAIMDAINAVETPYIRVYNDGERIGVLWVVDGEIADYTESLSI